MASMSGSNMRDITRTHGDIFSKVPKIGLGIVSSTPTPDRTPGPPFELDVDEDQNLNSKYVLSGTQRKLVADGYVKDRSKRNQQVLRKRDRLPERVQHLIDDVAVLHNTPFLSVEDWEDGLSRGKKTRSKWSEFHDWLDEANPAEENVDISQFEDTEIDRYESPFDTPSDLWEELIDVDQRSQQVRDDVHFHGESVFSQEAQFGFELGSLLRMLRPNYGDDPLGADLIWGFILSFIGEPKNSIEDEHKALDSLIAEVESRHEDRRRETELMPDPDTVSEVGREFDEETEEAVEELGLTAHPILVREVKYHQPVLDDDELRKNSAKNIVSKLIDAIPLREIDELQTHIAEDLDIIRDRSQPGVESARRILGTYVKDPEDETSEDDDSRRRVVPRQDLSSIATSLDIDESVVTGVLNRISDSDSSERWTTKPVVNKLEGEGRHVTWKLTAYGELLVYLSFEHSDDVSLLYWYALGPEELSLHERKMVTDALSEFGLVR